jgi:excinuclease UvrABC nuclease subunit
MRFYWKFDKNHATRYNVLLRDDKSYPWLCIKKEPFHAYLLEEWSKTDRNILVPTRVLRRFLPY